MRTVRSTNFWVGLAISVVLGGIASLCFSADGSKVVCRRTSEFNEIFVIDEPDGLRELRFERYGARQSVIKLDDPDHLELGYLKAILTALVLVDRPQRVLVVGLGGGTLPMYLHRHWPRCRIDCVEIDPEVVRVAKEFFGFKEDELLRAHVGDGRAFVEKVREPYDLIFLDAYGADSIPFHLATIEFLQAARKATTPDGLVVGNVWSRDSNRLYDRMVRTYQEVFPELYRVDVPAAGNRILLAPLTERKWTAVEVARRSALLTKRLKLRFSLPEIVLRNFVREDGIDRKQEPLRDAEQTK